MVVEGNLIDSIDVAVLFREEYLARKQCVVLKPFKIVKGNIECQDYMFIAEDGTAYHHIYEFTPGNSFAFRKSLIDLENEYQTQDFRLIKKMYLKEINNYYYYIDYDHQNLEIIMEDKITHELVKFNDNDYMEFTDPLNMAESELEKEIMSSDDNIKKNSQKSICDKKKEKNKFNTYKLAVEVKKKVIAQDNAIEVIVANIWNNLKLKENHNNILVIGNTGVGKTAIFRMIAKKLNIPFYQTSMANFSATGYVGSSVTDILEGLIMSCNGDVELAEHAIVFLDEIDKIADISGDNYKITNKAIQEELLTMLEDGVYTITFGNDFSGHKVIINTKDITFIGAGAFDGILQLNEEKHIGFGSRNNTKLNTYHEITNEHFINYGYKPEFIGRFPVVVALNDLTKENLITIMKSSENNILKEQIKVFNDMGIEVKFNEDVYDAIAEDAIKRKTGARGLNSAISRLFSEVLFVVSNPSNKCNYLEITKETVKDPSKYILLTHQVKKAKKRSLSKKVK